MTPSDVLAAGGIAPATALSLSSGSADADLVAGSDRLDALTFTHPALPGRVMVRLVPERVADGARTELALSGFVAGEVRPGVGRTRRRALGFPARAIAEDPANARYALGVMPAFNAAKKRIATKPGHARDAFVELADKLGRGAPHFLPSFWEEAGRAFLAHGSVAMAGTCFDKARSAEREHALPVDEDQRADAFVEFALAGALTVKSILAWPAELKRTEGPGVAFERLFELAVRRTLGGRAPWASLAKDLRDAARAAGRDPAVEEARFVRAVLGAVSMRRAPLGFWQAVADSVTPLAADPTVGDRLARFFPELSDAEDQAGWIALLDRWGILARLAERGVEGGLASWVERALAAWDDTPALHAVVLRMIPRLLAEGAPVAVFGEDTWSTTSIDTFEALLAAGVTLTVTDPDQRFALDDWAEREGERCDPVLLAAHPVLGPVLERSVRNSLDEESFQRVAVGRKAFEAARRSHLAAAVTAAGTGGLLDFETALEDLQQNVPPSTRAEFPAEAAPIAQLSAVPALARTLRGGVPDELGWPAFDAAWTELTGAQGASVTIQHLAPWAVLTDGRRAIVVGPGGREGTFDLKLPPKARRPRFRWSAGQLLVGWTDPQAEDGLRCYWSGSPKDIFEMEWGWERSKLQPPWGDGVLSGKRLLRPGDTALGTGECWCDAEGAWDTDDEGTLRALDPRTGKLGAPDTPAFFTARDGVKPDLGDARYTPNPVADSPLGGAGQSGWVGFDLAEVDAEAWLARHAPRALRLPGGEGHLTAYLGTDGQAVVSRRSVEALVRWPGHATPRVVADVGWRDHQLLDPEGAALAGLDEDSAWTHGSIDALPIEQWHHLRPRDPAASALLRTVDDALAARLVEAAADVEDDEDGRAAFLPALRAILPITDERLALGVAGIVIHAAGLQRQLEAWREVSVAVAVEGPTDEEVRAALGGLYQAWGADEQSVSAAIRSAAAFLGGADVAIAPTGLPWRAWLESPGAILFRSIAPATTPEETTTLTPLVDALLAGLGGARRRMGKAPRGSTWVKWVREYGERSVAEDFTLVEGGDRWVLHLEEDDEDAGTLTFDVLSSGDALPPGMTVDREIPLPPSAGLARWRGATLPVGDAVYAAISEPTGLSRAEAALVWAGMKGAYRWDNDPLGKVGREKLGVKLADLRAARELLSDRDDATLRAVLHAALEAADSPEALPAALAQAWVAKFGARVAIEEALLAAARVDLPGGEPSVLAEVASASGSPTYTRDAAWKMTASGVERADDGAEGFHADVLVRALGAVYWLHASTPGDHPLRAALPGVVALLRARAAAPGFVMEVVHTDEKPARAWYGRFAGAAFTPADLDPEADEQPTGKDRGGVLAVSDSDSVVIAVRPGRLDANDRDEVDKLARLEENWSDTDPWKALQRLSDPGLDALLADVAPGWAQDPRRSAPALVTAATAKLGLPEDAATLYLQLLALPNPTRANVLLWNGWKAPQYTKAAAALLEAKLVVEGKRPRAGREVFLPGGWHERKSGSLPLEEWKLPLFGGEEPPFGSVLPLTSFAELFTAAWAKVEAGKGPRFERVR